MTLEQVKRCKEKKQQISEIEIQLTNTKSPKKRKLLERQYEKITDCYREEC